ncbi:hypothetical protein [Sporosarcina highlanderae]|uniref:Uncharacterized protein n=1 Tax=Sporosarcina highlanderae TaxID=3035916 RepID=A0ABT8JVP9_9BACL|nr:hypothetical protein [Sporosarcina highlanderae]MDN4609230.1 hypothetical protein [Sporosarcina highlanderae]
MWTDPYETNATVIKHFAKELLSDGEKHSRKEIIDYVEKKTGRTDFTDGNYSGSLRDLLKEPGYENVERGWYAYRSPSDEMGAAHSDNVKGMESAESLNEIIYAILNRTIAQIETEVGKKNPLHLTNEDFESISKVRATIETIKDEIKKWS